MILNTQRDRSPRLARSRLGIFTTATAMVAVLAIGAGPRLVLAQATPKSPDEPEAAAHAAPSADAPDWSGGDSGPIAKPPLIESDAAPVVASVGIVSATPPVSAIAQVAPMAAVPAAPPAPEVPRRLAAPRSAKRQLSIEERLDRIESILEDLESHGRARAYSFGSGAGMSYAPPADTSADYASKRAGALAQRVTAEASRMQEDGRRTAEQAARAVEEGKRALEEGQRATERAAREFDAKVREFDRANQDPFRTQTEDQIKALQALREARSSLEIQIKSIERQIRRMEDTHHSSPKPDPSDDDDGQGPAKEKPAASKTS